MSLHRPAIYKPGKSRELLEERDVLKPLGIRRYTLPVLCQCGHRVVLAQPRTRRDPPELCFECLLAARKEHYAG